MKALIGTFALAAAVLLGAGSLHGAALTFDDTLATELVRISANDFEGA